MIEVSTKLLLAEPGGWQVLSVRAAPLQLTALAWLLLGVPATTQAAAAAFKIFSCKMHRIQRPTFSAWVTPQEVSCGLPNPGFSLGSFPSPGRRSHQPSLDSKLH